MNKSIENVNVRGRFLGVFVLVVIQSLIGFIHIFFGFAMILGIYSVASVSAAPLIYSYYTLTYGVLTLFFTILLWIGKRIGWIGTVAVSLFVIVVDTLALFGLFDLLGIPRSAGFGEIPYSLVILFYLLQNHIRQKYNI